MNKIQEAIISLLLSEPFYGHLILKMKISKSKLTETAGVYIKDTINLIYNEDFINKLELIDVSNVLKHECGHILQSHIPRFEAIGDQSEKARKTFNIAADATINTHSLIPTVKKLNGVTVDSLNKMLEDFIEDYNSKHTQKKSFQKLNKNELAEYYYNRINEFAQDNQEYIDELCSQENLMDDHSIWEKSEGSEELQKEIIRKTVNEAVKNSGGIGSLPSDVITLVNELNKSQVNWKSQLRQFYANTVKSIKEKTRKRRNRRYGIINPGIKKNPELHLALCVDTSGSVSNEELSMFWSEIKAISMDKIKITVIEADSVVQNFYEFDTKKTPEFKGRGGTMYQPAIDKALELEADGIIYCGDFDAADTPKNPNKPFLWVGVRNSPPPADFGRVIYLENVY